MNATMPRSAQNLFLPLYMDDLHCPFLQKLVACKAGHNYVAGMPCSVKQPEENKKIPSVCAK